MAVSKPISIDEARAIIREKVSALPPAIEEVPVLESLGRVIAEDLYSDIDVSPFAHSAMDGFAVLVDDLQNASTEAPVSLRIVAHIGAGDVYEGELQPGECIRIMTGAATPAGEIAVVKIEDVSFSASADAPAENDVDVTGMVGEYACFTAPIKLGRNIRQAGEEVKAGELAFRKGEQVYPAGAGLLASTGHLTVPVYKRPKVGVIVNGSELVHASQKPEAGKIRDSNSWSIAAYVMEAGGIPVNYPIVADDPEAIKAAYAKAIEECDLVVSTGGACLGDFDFAPGIVAEMGELFFTVVSMRPGKSQPFGIVDNTPVFVLSGNPAASAVGFEMFVRVALCAMQGKPSDDRLHVKAKLTIDQKKHESRVFLQRGLVEVDGENENGLSFKATPFKTQSSGLYGEVQRANALIILPEGARDWSVGEEVECIMLRK